MLHREVKASGELIAQREEQARVIRAQELSLQAVIAETARQRDLAMEAQREAEKIDRSTTRIVHELREAFKEPEAAPCAGSDLPDGVRSWVLKHASGSYDSDGEDLPSD